MGELRIDGSYGEGGGQILRTSLSLSIALGRPVEVYNIRAKRESPGLRPQHLATLRCLAQVSNGEVEGDEVGSSRVFFRPRTVRGGRLEVDIGTAGSITLLLQAAVPAVSLAGAELTLLIRGGTEVRWSPTIDYFARLACRAYERIGVRASIRVLRRGYYPRGGGLVEAAIRPAEPLRPVAWLEGEDVPVEVISACGALPRHVCERQAEACRRALEAQGLRVGGVLLESSDTLSPGSSVTALQCDGQGTFRGADALGERGKPAERVGEEAALKLAKEASTGAPVDSHLADMLPPLLALAPSLSSYRTSAVTEHLRTNLYVASLFTGARYEISPYERGGYVVRIEPAPGKG
ncbi:MAG: RNA 3'-phosphate cyclase [Nitrososphaerota archaeon]